MVQETGDTGDAFCLFAPGAKDYLVGVVGAGSALDATLELVAGGEFREFLPPMRLAGVAGLALNDARRASPLLRGVPFYATAQALFADNPGINLVVAAGEDCDVRQLVAELPPGASFIDNTAAFFLGALTRAVSSGERCRVRLDRQRMLLETIIDEVKEDIVLVAASGVVVDCNSYFASRLGRTKADVAGVPCRELYGGPGDPPLCDPDDPECPFRVALTSGEKAERLHSAVAADGRLRYHRTYAYPVRDESRRVSHVVVFRRDITDRTVRRDWIKARAWLYQRLEAQLD